MNATAKHRAISAVAVGAAIALAGGLAACSSEGAQSSDSLTFWIMGDDGPQFEELIEPWTNSTGVTVEVVGVPWDSFDDRITTSIASGDGPDLMQVGIDRVRTLSDAGVLEPLDDFVADRDWLSADYYPTGASESMTVAGELLTVPWISDPRVLFYRSDVLAAEGIDGPPTTWDELAADAAVLAARGDDHYGYYAPQWDQGLPVAMTWSRGGDIIDAEGNLDFDTPEFRETLQYLSDLYDAGSVPANSDFDGTQGFISGIAPMVISGPWMASSVQGAAPELDGKWDVTSVPAGSAGPVSQWAGSNLGIWADTPNRDRAIELIEFLAQPGTQVQWFELAGRMPASTEALTDETLNADPFFAVYADQLETSRPLPLIPNWNAGPARDMLDAILSVVLQDTSIDDAVATLNEQTAGLSIN